MSKVTKSAEELLAMLNEELRRTAHCEHIEVTGVYGVDDESVDFNWRAQALRSRTGDPISGDCMRAVEAASNRLGRLYDLEKLD